MRVSTSTSFHALPLAMTALVRSMLNVPLKFAVPPPVTLLQTSLALGANFRAPAVVSGLPAAVSVSVPPVRMVVLPV